MKSLTNILRSLFYNLSLFNYFTFKTRLVGLNRQDLDTLTFSVQWIITRFNFQNLCIFETSFPCVIYFQWHCLPSRTCLLIKRCATKVQKFEVCKTILVTDIKSAMKCFVLLVFPCTFSIFFDIYLQKVELGKCLKSYFSVQNNSWREI